MLICNEIHEPHLRCFRFVVVVCHNQIFGLGMPMFVILVTVQCFLLFLETLYNCDSRVHTDKLSSFVLCHHIDPIGHQHDADNYCLCLVCWGFVFGSFSSHLIAPANLSPLPLPKYEVSKSSYNNTTLSLYIYIHICRGTLNISLCILSASFSTCVIYTYVNA